MMPENCAILGQSFARPPLRFLIDPFFVVIRRISAVRIAGFQHSGLIGCIRESIVENPGKVSATYSQTYKSQNFDREVGIY